MMISGATGREFDERLYIGLDGAELWEAQLRDGVVSIEWLEKRVREIEAEIEGEKMSGMLAGVIPITQRMIVGGQNATAMREVLAKNGRGLPEEPVSRDSSETGQALRMLDKMTPEQFAAWNERELKRQKYDNPKPEYPNGPTYYDEDTQIWDD